MRPYREKEISIVFAVLVPLMALIYFSFLVEADPRLISIGVYIQVILSTPLVLNLKRELGKPKDGHLLTLILLVLFWGLPFLLALLKRAFRGTDMSLRESLFSEEFALFLIESQFGILALICVGLVIALWGYTPRK